MKFIFTSARVNIAVILGLPEEEEEDEHVHNTGGQFEVAEADYGYEVLDFGYSPVRS